MAKQDAATQAVDEVLLSLNDFLTNLLIERGLIEEPDDDGDVDPEDLEDDADEEDSDDEDDEDADEDEDEDGDEDEPEEITERREELLGFSTAKLKKAVTAVDLDPADLKGVSLEDIVEMVLEKEFAPEDDDEDVDLDDLAGDEDEDDEPEPEPVKPAKKAAAKKSAPAKKTTTKGRLRAK